MSRQPPQLNPPNFICWALLRHHQHVLALQPSTALFARISQGKEEGDPNDQVLGRDDFQDIDNENGYSFSIRVASYCSIYQ
jgi:hypothetical protein